MVQMKRFYRQRIPGSGCVRKETIYIDILVTSRNSDRKIKQFARLTMRPPSRISKSNQWNRLKFR